MKLHTRYHRLNLFVSIGIFIIAAACYYFMLHFVLIQQLDKDLKVEEEEISDFVNSHDRLPDPSNYKDQQISFNRLSAPLERNFSSAEIFSPDENEYISLRRLIFSIDVAGSPYAVTVSKSQQETEDMISIITLITLSIVILLLLVLIILNRFVLNKLWLPFYDAVKQLRKFNLAGGTVVNLPSTGIDEFDELNTAASLMSSQALREYESLKSFTENASHEIQTPLAVINAKLELLMQSENFSEQQMEYVETILGETRRLSKLNQSLLLLTKIENQQFRGAEHIALGKIINKQLNNFEELIEAKGITLKKNIDPGVSVFMNEALAEIMISNLLTNAIKHNTEHGTIEVTANDNHCTICNTGAVLSGKTEELFGRFKKDKQQSDSLGLGLSIVHKICDQHHFSLHYVNQDTLHIVSVHFTEKQA